MSKSPEEWALYAGEICQSRRREEAIRRLAADDYIPPMEEDRHEAGNAGACRWCISEFVRAAQEEARQEEREACAQLVKEQWGCCCPTQPWEPPNPAWGPHDGSGLCWLDIAAAIRARGQAAQS